MRRKHPNDRRTERRTPKWKYERQIRSLNRYIRNGNDQTSMKHAITILNYSPTR